MQKEQKTILSIYIGFLIAVIFNFIPSSAVSTFGGILLIVLVIAAYIYRFRAEENSLTKNHMAYLIKSFWIASLFLLVGMIAAYVFADHSIINNSIETIKNGIIMSQEQIESLLMDYARANIFVFFATLSPSFIYLFYRLVKGMIHAKKSQSVVNLKNWF